MGKVGGWLAGILAVVIGSYAVWYLTVGRFTTTTFEGMVYSNNTPVSHAMVTLELRGTGLDGSLSHDWTDENGSYHFEAKDLPKNATAALGVSATGYEGVSTFPLHEPLETDNRRDIPLNPLSVAHPPATGAGTLAPGSGMRVLRYIPKSLAVTVPKR